MLLHNPYILITVPTSPAYPYIHKHVTACCLKLLANKRYRVSIIFPSHNPYENNLNHIVCDFLEGEYTHWLNIDSDNPPRKNPLDLVELNLDIVGLPTPVWHFIGKEKGERPLYWNGYDYVKEKDAYREHQPQKGLQKVDAIGTGCFLIHQRVFHNEKMQRGPFLRQYYNNGTVKKGNDISFCEKARACGFKIYCHYDFPCMHFVELEIGEIITAFRQLYE